MPDGHDEAFDLAGRHAVKRAFDFGVPAWLIVFHGEHIIGVDHGPQFIGDCEPHSGQ